MHELEGGVEMKGGCGMTEGMWQQTVGQIKRRPEGGGNLYLAAIAKAQGQAVGCGCPMEAVVRVVAVEGHRGLYR